MAFDGAISNSQSRIEMDDISNVIGRDHEEDSSDSNAMMIDESSQDSTREEEESSQKKQQEPQTMDKKPDVGDKTNEPTKAGKRKKAKEKKKKPDEDDLACPNKIINKILSKSSFQVANLSQIIEEKFFEADDYKKELSKALNDVHYESTVIDLGDDFSLTTSVRPIGWQGTVNLEPSAFLSMNCIHEKPPKRERNRGNKASKKKNAATAPVRPAPAQCASSKSAPNSERVEKI